MEENGADVDVVRNDFIPFELIDTYDAIVLSPGPGVPSDAGDLKKVIQQFNHKPMLGICLGMQAMGEVYQGKLDLLDHPYHGLSSEISHQNQAIFEGVESPFLVGRYHSWVVNEESLNQQFEILAKDEAGDLMAFKHKDLPLYGFQFHPESVLTPDGRQLIKNFLNQIQSNGTY